MPTNFPTSVDNFTNPTANDSLNLPSHSTQHANANDAIEAVEDYLLNGGQGLTLVKKQTIGSAVASVAVTSAFSATYENYVVVVTGGTMSTTNSINMILGATTSGYSNVLVYGSYTSTTVTAVNNNAGSSWTFMGYGNTNTAFLQCELYQPFLTKNTLMASNHMQFAGLVAGRNGGVLNDSTSYTGFTITPVAGTLTGGTIYVYGYGKGQ